MWPVSGKEWAEGLTHRKAGIEGASEAAEQVGRGLGHMEMLSWMCLEQRADWSWERERGIGAQLLLAPEP